jgi:hypothetical protein
MFFSRESGEFLYRITDSMADEIDGFADSLVSSEDRLYAGAASDQQ